VGKVGFQDRRVDMIFTDDIGGNNRGRNNDRTGMENCKTNIGYIDITYEALASVMHLPSKAYITSIHDLFPSTCREIIRLKVGWKSDGRGLLIVEGSELPCFSIDDDEDSRRNENGTN
jgi:hypothetical protein